MEKKGTSFVMTVIVIAALLLVVMVILLVFFSDKFTQFSEETESCLFKGGECVDSCTDGREVDAKCPEGKVCCVGG
ncbi:MAG: hypothetical protein KAT77_02140 [Nanoarchaeota archaeon]|nr:hypothetical protein [Nanoarchaeota archaeon]